MIVDRNGIFGGTGFFIGNEYCVTCHHNIFQFDEIYIQKKNKKLPAEWVEEYSNAEKDIAILKIRNSGFRPLLRFPQLTPGTEVFVFGFSHNEYQYFKEGSRVMMELRYYRYCFYLPRIEWGTVSPGCD